MFKKKFPFVNFRDVIIGSGPPRQRQKVDLRVVRDGKGEAPFYSVSSTGDQGPAPKFAKPPPAPGFPWEEISIGRITLTEKTTWADLENMITKNFKNYINEILTYAQLGLSPDSISSYEIPNELLREFKSKDGPSKPRPIHYFKDEYYNIIRIYLKGAAQQGAIDALSFQLQIPKNLLAKHIERLDERGRLVFCGPRFVHARLEMRFVAKKLGEYMLIRRTRMEGRVVSAKSHYHVAIYNAKDIDDRSTCGLAAFMEDIKERCRLARLFGNFDKKVGDLKEEEGQNDGKTEEEDEPKPGPSRDCNKEKPSKSKKNKSSNSSSNNQQVGVPPPYVVVVENLQCVSHNLCDIIRILHEFQMSCKEVKYFIGTFVRPIRSRPINVQYGVY